MILAPEPSLINQAQPEPKRPMAAFWNWSLKAAKSPNDDLMAFIKAPVGSPPAFGAMISQTIGWLTGPPALLRTVMRIDSGTLFKSLINASALLSCRAAWPSSALLRLVT